EQVTTTLQKNLQSEFQKETTTYFQRIARTELLNAGGGAAGGGAGGTGGGGSPGGTRKSLGEKLTPVGSSTFDGALSGAIGAVAMGNGFKALGHGFEGARGFFKGEPEVRINSGSVLHNAEGRIAKIGGPEGTSSVEYHGAGAHEGE